MSQEKTIKISPELFSLKSNKNKTLKNKGKEKKPDIKINNAVKSKLIEKVKEFQKKNKQEAIEKKNTNQNFVDRLKMHRKFDYYLFIGGWNDTFCDINLVLKTISDWKINST